MAINANGDVVTSSKNMMENASFEEALESIVMSRADKDFLLRGVNGGGTGGDHNGGGSGQKRVVTREQEKKMSLEERASFMDSVAKGTAQLVD